MMSRVEKVILEDTDVLRSSSALWNIQSDLPEIRQVYGSYLPPPYLKAGEGLVAKDFSFPADAVIPKIASLSIDKKFMDQLSSMGERISSESSVSIARSVRIRVEEHGAVVYTPYFSGFYLNRIAYDILRLCDQKLKTVEVASKLGYNIGIIINFLVRCLALGLVDVVA